ncbi:hypothetical protein F4782DRAFT_550756 [Xylaria castorea]|nr:hypothetical protein F4782DRAFT_550756 [Xylaria castorea]
MATAVSSMADDWEYIDDDTYSIISLLSDDDAPEPSLDSEVVCSVDSLTDDLIYPCHRPRSESPTRNDSKPSDANTEPNSARTVGRCGTNQVDVVNPDTTRGKLKGKATNDGASDALCERIRSLIQLLDELLSSPGLRDQSHGLPRHLRAACESLRSQLDWIRDMWHIYARQAKAELPISLSEWVDSLEVELLKIHSRLIGPRIQYSSASYMSYVDEANEWYKTIKKLRIQMDGMITVIHSDFLNLRSPLMSESRGNSPITNRKAHERSLDCIASGSRKNSWSHLRRELYSLRDQIVACLGEIHSYGHHGFYDLDQYKKITRLTLSYKNTKGLLERLLSNQESDRVPTVVPGLTNHEFCQLNPDTISSLVLQLKEVTDVLFLERSRVQTRRHRDGRSENHGKLFISASSMDMLRTIDETLVSILCPPTRK